MSSCLILLLFSLFQSGLSFGNAANSTNEHQLSNEMEMSQPGERKEKQFLPVIPPKAMWMNGEDAWVIMYNVHKQSKCDAICYQLGARTTYWSPKYDIPKGQDAQGFLMGMCQCCSDDCSKL